MARIESASYTAIKEEFFNEISLSFALPVPPYRELGEIVASRIEAVFLTFIAIVPFASALALLVGKEAASKALDKILPKSE